MEKEEKKEETKYFARAASGLVRQVTAFDVLTVNMVLMGIGYVFLYSMWAENLFPGVDLPATVAVAILPSIAIAFTYLLLSQAMPRSGGDYIWTSRIIHPILGFIGNFYMTAVISTFLGMVAGMASYYGIAVMLMAAGLASNNSGLTKLGLTVSSTPWSFIIAVAVIILLVVPMFFGTKAAFRVQISGFLISMLGVLTYIVVSFVTPQHVFVSNFERLTGASYQSIISVAHTAGYGTGILLGATLLGSIYTALNYAGFTYSASISGEVKQVRKSQLYGMVGAALLFGLLMYLIYAGAYNAMGQPFYSSLSFLAETGNKAYPLAFPEPALNYMIVFSSPNVIIVVLASLAVIGTCFTAIPAGVFICARNFFAYAFDRVLPTKVASVDKRFHAPYYAILISTIWAIIGAYLFLYTSFYKFVIWGAFANYIAFGIGCLAGALFPFRLKELFERSPAAVKRKVLGIPVISILGIIGFAYSMFIAIASLTPSFVGTVPVESYVMIVAIAVAAILIYSISYVYHKSKGVPLDLTFKEIPPE
ncbi:MAG: amino acid permease [Candidatus Bathyarchaeia archaeon]|jgi:amino acid transporter